MAIARLTGPLNESQRARRLKLEVLKSPFGRGAAPRSALDQAPLEEVGLIHVLDRVLLLPYGHRQCGQPDRAAGKLFADRAQDLPVQPIEPFVIDLEQIER